MPDKKLAFFHLTRDIDVPLQICIRALDLDILADDWRESRGLQKLVAASVPCPSSSTGRSPASSFPVVRALSVVVTASLEDDFGAIGAALESKIVETTGRAGSWCAWDDQLTFPLKVKDLQPSARIHVVSRCLDGHEGEWRVLGECTVPLFHRNGRLRAGEERVALQIAKVQDAARVEGDDRDEMRCASQANGRDVRRLMWLRRQQKAFEEGHIERLAWLDGLGIGIVEDEISRLRRVCNLRRGLELVVDLPRYTFDVFFCDVGMNGGAGQRSRSRPLATTGTLVGKSSGTDTRRRDYLVTFVDPEINKESPAELMAQKMVRSQARESEKEQLSVALRPNTQERQALDQIVAYPPNRELGQEEKNLVWRFRYTLATDRSALTKFLRCVDWADAVEATQAGNVMANWAKIDIGDALDMLSPSFKSELVRSHAVAFLQSLPDEDINSIVLQLVQALRYETEDVSDLSNFLLERARGNKVISSSVFWNLCSELEDETFGSRAQVLQTALLSELDVCAHHPGDLKDDGDKSGMGNASIPLQLNLLARLRHLHDSVKLYRTAEAKTEHLRVLLAPGGSCEDLATSIYPNPLHPTTMLYGVVPEKCLVFRSKVKPIKFTWRGGDPADSNGRGDVSFIYKKGDDLRQDQLVMQIFVLMDKLLKKEHLDLQITTYGILPTSLDDGLIEFVPNASPLSTVLQTHGSILGYLSSARSTMASVGTNSAPSATVNTSTTSTRLYNYIRSCAGYVVFTHVLGIGDRHQDNIMITSEGKLFHIDFGYILGTDPKFKQAPLVLTRPMVDAMGDEYMRFVELACEALNILRKSAGLLLSVIHVMARSSIPDIRVDPEMAMLKVQERLWLDLSDEAAAKTFEALLASAQYAVLPKLAEFQHGLAKTLQ